MNIPYVAFKNLKRNLTRSWLLLLVVAVVSCALFSGTLFLKSVSNALRQGTGRLGTEIMVVPDSAGNSAKAALLSGEPAEFFMDKAVLDRVRKVMGVSIATPQLFIKPAVQSCCFNADAFIVAVDPDTDFTVRPWLEKNLRGQLGSDEIIAGSAIPVGTGDTVPFFNMSFQVAGIMEPTGMDFFDKSVFMSIDSAYRMVESPTIKTRQKTEINRDRISAVLVRIDRDSIPDRIAWRIEKDVSGVKALVSDAVIGMVKKQLSGLAHAVAAISAILWLIVFLILAFAFYMIVNERRREIGLLRAMGASRLQVLSLIASEASLLSLGGWTAGILLGFGFLMMFKNLMLRHLKLPYLLPPIPEAAGLIAGAACLSLLTGILSAVLPSLLIIRAEPYESIRNGE